MIPARSSLWLILALSSCDPGAPPGEGEASASLAQAPPDRAAPSEAAREALRRGRDLYQAERAPEALGEVRRAVQLAPGWLEARMALGKLALTLSAVKFGTAHHEQTLLEEALEQFERAVALAPNDAEAAYWSGQALFTDERYREAIRSFERALALAPEHALAAKGLGLAHAAEGDVASAKAALQRARVLLPKDDEVLFQLGLQLENEDDAQGAIALYLQAIQLNPAHSGPRTRLVSLYERRGNTAAALKASEDLVRCKEVARRLSQATQRAEQNTRDPAAFVEVGRLYLELGMLEPARSWAERALRIDGTDAAAQELKEGILEAQRKKDAEERERSRLIAPEGDAPR